MSGTDELLTALGKIDPSSFANDAERKKVRDALYEAYRKVQVPWEVTWELILENICVTTSVKTLLDMGLFTKWAEREHKPTTTAEFAELTGADEKLIRRMLLLLASRNLVEEIAENTFGATPWARAFAADPLLESAYGTFWTFNTALAPKFPDYLKACGYRPGVDATDCNFQYVYGKDAMPFASFGQTSQTQKEMNDFFECHSRYDFLPWTSIYPTQRIVDDAAAREKEEGKKDEPSSSRALVVDVGGNKGHDLEKFRRAHPDVPRGSLVLQDLRATLDAAPEAHETITVQRHDFFDEQPVRGARAYFLHNIIHDWPDDKSVLILRRIADAMERGYSRVLLHESLVRPFKPGARLMTSDSCMMWWFAAHERYEPEMRSLLEKAGLRIVEIWRPTDDPSDPECIIEAELA